MVGPSARDRSSAPHRSARELVGRQQVDAACRAHIGAERRSRSGPCRDRAAASSRPRSFSPEFLASDRSVDVGHQLVLLDVDAERRTRARRRRTGCSSASPADKGCNASGRVRPSSRTTTGVPAKRGRRAGGGGSRRIRKAQRQRLRRPLPRRQFGGGSCSM